MPFTIKNTLNIFLLTLLAPSELQLFQHPTACDLATKAISLLNIIHLCCYPLEAKAIASQHLGKEQDQSFQSSASQ